MARKKKKRNEGDADISSNNQNSWDENPLIVVSKKPTVIPEEKPLKESEKHLNPPQIELQKEVSAHNSWGPANRKKR